MSKYTKSKKIAKYKANKRRKDPSAMPVWLKMAVIAEFIIIVLFRIDRLSTQYLFNAIIACMVTYVVLFAVWKIRYRIKLSGASIQQVDKMTGEQFEEFLAICYKKHGFDVKMTPKTCDFGADLLLTDPKTGTKVCIQAKRYRGLVGEEAVQQTLSGREYYKCDKAMIVTNSHYTDAAKALAKRCDIKMIDRFSLGKEEMYMF